MEVSKQLHTPAAFTPEKEYGSDTWTVKARDAKRITTGDEIHEKNSRDTLGQITKQIHNLQRN